LKFFKSKLFLATATTSIIYISIPSLSLKLLKDTLSFKMILGFALIAEGVMLIQFGNA